MKIQFFINITNKYIFICITNIIYITMENITKKIKELAVKDGFDPREVDALLNHAKILTGKTIKEYLIGIINVELSKKDPQKHKKLMKEVNKIDVPGKIFCPKIISKEVNLEIELNIQIG